MLHNHIYGCLQDRENQTKLFLQSKRREIRPSRDLTYGNTIKLEMLRCGTWIDESKLATGTRLKDLFIAVSEGEVLIERM